MEDDKVKEFLQFQIRRKITNLYKNFLFILEDLKAEQYNMPDEVYQRHRKRILDHGNDAIRDLEECMKSLKINLK